MRAVRTSATHYCGGGTPRTPATGGIPRCSPSSAYRYGQGSDKDRVAASWYEKAAAIPGRPDYIPRLAAALLSRGGETQKAILMWGQVYASGDKYVREKAVTELDKLLPAAKGLRMKALAPLYVTMPKPDFDQLLAALFPGG